MYVNGTICVLDSWVPVLMKHLTHMCLNTHTFYAHKQFQAETHAPWTWHGNYLRAQASQYGNLSRTNCSTRVYIHGALENIKEPVLMFLFLFLFALKPRIAAGLRNRNYTPCLHLAILNENLNRKMRRGKACN